jgi:hypothetical protein
MTATKTAPGEVQLVEGQESAPAEATDLAPIVPKCESRYHGAEGEDHHGDSARYAVLVDCPLKCRAPRWVLLCRGKVDATFQRGASGRDVLCGGCECSAPVWAFWARVVAIDTMEIVAERLEGSRP